MLKWLHRFAVEPPDQSIRGGTQFNLLTTDKYKVIRTFLRALSDPITRIINEQWKFEGVWSSNLNRGGQHVKHVHPKGWISGCCYIDVPDNRSAHLTCFTDPCTVIIPEAGKCVLFPSWLPHEVSVYAGERPRLTIAFDLVKP